MMKSKQKGEVMLAMMAVMLVVWLANGHMGLMGHGSGATDKPAAAAQHDEAKSNAVPEQKR